MESSDKTFVEGWFEVYRRTYKEKSIVVLSPNMEFSIDGKGYSNISHVPSKHCTFHYPKYTQRRSEKAELYAEVTVRTELTYDAMLQSIFVRIKASERVKRLTLLRTSR